MTSFVKNGLTLIGLIIIGGLGYYLFVMNGSSNLSIDDEGGINEAQLASEQFLRQLEEIKKFELSDEIFVDQRFRSLVDFTEPIPSQPVGRENPFAPVR